MLGPKPFNNSFVKWVRSKSKSGNILIRPSYEGSDKDFAISFTTSKTKTIMNTVEYTLRLEHMLFIIQSSILAKETFKKNRLEVKANFLYKNVYDFFKDDQNKVEKLHFNDFWSYYVRFSSQATISYFRFGQNRKFDPICKIIMDLPGSRIKQLSIDDSS